MRLLKVEIAAKPHTSPKNLPTGKMAVYAFFLNGQALKVGKDAIKIQATGIDATSAGGWLRKNTDRVNLLMPTALGIPILSLLEAFLHVRWKPLFEGRTESD